MIRRKRTTYRMLIEAEMQKRGETWDDVEFCTMPERRLDKPRQLSMHSLDTVPFTMWTKGRVYFPVLSDEMGIVHIESVPRHPCKETNSFYD